MTYKDYLSLAMINLAQDPLVRFIGYNIAKGPRMNGTLNDIPVEKCIETPVAENLMCGIAMGLALEGFKPVLCFERMDFCLAAADALVNHIAGLGHYGVRFNMIIRVCVGNDKPLDPGIQHKQKYVALFKDKFCGGELIGKSSILPNYKFIGRPHMLVEYKEKYNE